MLPPCGGMDERDRERAAATSTGWPVETQPQKVKRRSRDFYWYSPVLKRQLDHVTADPIVTPKNEAEVDPRARRLPTGMACR